MTKTVVVTTGNGMFGRALINQLVGDPAINVRALVRDAAKFDVAAPNVTSAIADMDRPATLKPAMADATHIFLVSPMDEHIAERERNVIDAALATGSKPHVLKLFGAVKHRGDALAEVHGQSLDYLKESGLPWTLISPNSVMETSLKNYAETLRYDAMFGTTGHGKVGLVALRDVARATADIIREDTAIGENVLLTGPQSVSLYDVAQAFSDALGRTIHYYDMPEDAFADMLLKEGAFPDRETLEIQVLLHYRAWARGDADLVTDDFRRVTGEDPTSVAAWIADNLAMFNEPQTDEDKAIALGIAEQFSAP